MATAANIITEPTGQGQAATNSSASATATKKVSLTLPSDIYDALKSAADADDRTLSNFLERRIRLNLTTLISDSTSSTD